MHKAATAPDDSKRYTGETHLVPPQNPFWCTPGSAYTTSIHVLSHSSTARVYGSIMSSVSDDRLSPRFQNGIPKFKMGYSSRVQWITLKVKRALIGSTLPMQGKQTITGRLQADVLKYFVH